MKIIYIIGATGLVGAQVLELLSSHEQISKIVAITRKKLIFTHPKIQNLIIDFSNLSKINIETTGNIFISCLGTTLNQAGSPENFRKIDFEYNIEFAKLAEKSQAQKFLLVSSLGANKKSNIFYSKIKGELEFEVQKLNIPQIEIFRPSLLIGTRIHSRPGENFTQRLMPIINPLLFWHLKKYRSIKSQDVANAICHAAMVNKIGHYIYESDKIFEMSQN